MKKMTLAALALVGMSFAGHIPETHDGFLFKYEQGWGQTSITEEYKGEKGTYSGIGTNSVFGLGFSINPEMSLAFDLGFQSVSNPEVKFDDKKFDYTGDLTIGHYFTGITYTYYIMPMNINIGLGVGYGVGALLYSDKNDGGDGDLLTPNLHYRAFVGKEWWISNNWELGANLYYNAFPTKRDISYSTVKTDYSVSQVGLAFTINFN